nr:hypothetical protein CTI12_AA424460 [Tanacetum cinerariifolium]
MSKNGKLLAMGTSMYLTIFSIFVFLNMSSIKPIISDFITKAMELPSQDPQESLHFAESLVTIQKYIRSFLGAQLAFGLPLFLTSLFGQTAITLLAAVSYRDKKISLKNLISRMPQASTRLFLTSFQVTLMRVGFFLLGFLVLLVPTIMISDNLLASLVISLVLLIFVVSLYVYFSVVWVLSLVISVLEECSGIEALGKAARLVTGKKFEGFLLFISINLLSYILYKVLSNIIVVKHSELTQEISRVFIGSFLSLTGMFESQAYTVLYFECKKTHGIREAIELKETVEHSQVQADSFNCEHHD